MTGGVAAILALRVAGAQREAICAECGAAFEQEQLNAEAVRQRWGDGALAACERDIPELWVPVYCGRCEHRRLGELADEREQRAPSAPPREKRVQLDQEHFARGFHTLLTIFNPSVPPSHVARSQEYFPAIAPAMTNDEFDRAVIEAVRSLKWFPKPAELLELRDLAARHAAPKTTT